jgi:hypothetical protein
MIAKLTPSWRDFTTTLKHKRTDISVSDLIISFDVAKKVWLRMDDLKELRVRPVPT